MLHLVGNLEDRFSPVAAHIKVGFKGVYIAGTCLHDVKDLTSCDGTFEIRCS